MLPGPVCGLRLQEAPREFPPGHLCPHSRPSSLLRLVLYRHPSLIRGGWGGPPSFAGPSEMQGCGPGWGEGVPQAPCALGAGEGPRAALGAVARPALSPQLGLPEGELHLQRVVPRDRSTGECSPRPGGRGPGRVAGGCCGPGCRTVPSLSLGAPGFPEPGPARGGQDWGVPEGHPEGSGSRWRARGHHRGPACP